MSQELGVIETISDSLVLANAPRSSSARRRAPGRRTWFSPAGRPPLPGCLLLGEGVVGPWWALSEQAERNFKGEKVCRS